MKLPRGVSGDRLWKGKTCEERVKRSFDPGLEKDDADEGRSARNEDRNTHGSEWARGAGDCDPKDE